MEGLMRFVAFLGALIVGTVIASTVMTIFKSLLRLVIGN